MRHALLAIALLLSDCTPAVVAGGLHGARRGMGSGFGSGDEPQCSSMLACPMGMACVMPMQWGETMGRCVRR